LTHVNVKQIILKVEIIILSSFGQPLRFDQRPLTSWCSALGYRVTNKKLGNCDITIISSITIGLLCGEQTTF